MDIAEGHLAALNFIENTKGLHTINLGSGRGYSVLDVLIAFEQTSNKFIPYKIENRRPGDIDICFAMTEKAEKCLKWKAKRTLNDMCWSAWNFHFQNFVNNN